MRGHKISAYEVGSVGVDMLARTDGSSRFAANGYKSICTGGVRIVQCGSSLVSLFCTFLKKGRTSYLSGKKRAEFIAFPNQLWAHTKSVPSILVHINTTFTHSRSLWKMDSSSWFKLFSLPYIPFALPHSRVLALAISPPECQNLCVCLVLSDRS